MYKWKTITPSSALPCENSPNRSCRSRQSQRPHVVLLLPWQQPGALAFFFPVSLQIATLTGTGTKKTLRRGAPAIRRTRTASASQDARIAWLVARLRRIPRRWRGLTDWSCVDDLLISDGWSAANWSWAIGIRQRRGPMTLTMRGGSTSRVIIDWLLLVMLMRTSTTVVTLGRNETD